VLRWAVHHGCTWNRPLCREFARRQGPSAAAVVEWIDALPSLP